MSVMLARLTVNDGVLELGRGSLIAACELTGVELHIPDPRGVRVAATRLTRCDLSDTDAAVFSECTLVDCTLPTGDFRSANRIVRTDASERPQRALG